MHVRLIDPANPTWGEGLDDLYARAGGATNPTLFPYHFLQAALPRIGGHLAVVEDDSVPLAGAFLFPRLTSSYADREQQAYTLRLYPFPDCTPVAAGAVAQQLSEKMAAAVIPYDPQGKLHFEPTHETW